MLLLWNYLLSSVATDGLDWKMDQLNDKRIGQFLKFWNCVSKKSAEHLLGFALPVRDTYQSNDFSRKFPAETIPLQVFKKIVRGLSDWA